MQKKAAYIRSKVDRPFPEPCTSGGYVHRAALFIKWIMEFRFSKSRLETWLVTDCSSKFHLVWWFFASSNSSHKIYGIWQYWEDNEICLVQAWCSLLHQHWIPSEELAIGHHLVFVHLRCIIASLKCNLLLAQKGVRISDIVAIIIFS
jgi:hypothetical protein